MNRYRLFYCVICSLLVFVMIAGLPVGQALQATQEVTEHSLVMSPAEDEEDTEEDSDEVELSILLDCKYPVVIGESGDIFTYDVAVKYEGNERRGFEISTIVSEDWAAIVTAGIPEKEIPYLELEPYGTITGQTETIKVTFGALTYYPEPGEYRCILQIKSGDDLSDSIDLKAVVKEKYGVTVKSGLADENVNPKVDAGKEYHMPILLQNTGSADIENITFDTDMPEGWVVTYNPSSVSILEEGLTQEVDVLITASKDTDGGDYIVDIKPDSQVYKPEPLELRVKVQSGTVWGGAGIAIVVVVVAGLAFMFKRSGKW